MIRVIKTNKTTGLERYHNSQDNLFGILKIGMSFFFSLKQNFQEDSRSSKHVDQNTAMLHLYRFYML